jgi:hypothetical protein
MSMKSLIIAPCLFAGIAYAQPPTDFIDLGTFQGEPVSVSVPIHLEQANEITWFRVEVPMLTATAGFFDFGTFIAGEFWMPNEFHSPEFGVFDGVGDLVVRPTMYGPNNSAHASFGLSDPSRPCPDHYGDIGLSCIPYEGQTGSLSAGIYWIALGNRWVSFGSTNWFVGNPTPPDFRERDTVVRFRYHPPTIPFCDPDFNWDGASDQDDVRYLVDVIAGGENRTGRNPDYNLDGNADFDDVRALIDVIAGGGCP